MTTTMNTGAASLSDEQRTTIQHAADKLRTVWANHTGDKESRELCHKLEFILADTTQQADERERFYAQGLQDGIRIGESRSTPQADADFKNFHRLLCERFDYVHDERDWKRDQLSLIEHIASGAAIAAGGAQETIYQRNMSGAWIDTTLLGYENWPEDQRRIVYAAPLPRVAATVPSPLDSLAAFHAEQLESNPYCYFELAYTRQTGWMAWITDRPAQGEPGTAAYAKSRKVIVRGQGETAREACEDALSLIAAASAGEQG